MPGHGCSPPVIEREIMVDSAEKVIDKHLRPTLQELFSQLAEGQRSKFKRIFGSVDETDANKIPHAIAICEYTINKNKAEN